MADQIEIRLKDSVSDASAKIQKSLQRLSGAQGVTGFQRSFDSLKRSLTVEKFTAVLHATQLLGNGLSSMAKTAWGGVELVANAADFQKRALAALTIVDKSSTEAQSVLNQIRDASKAANIPKQVLLDQYLALRNMEAPAEQVKDTMAAMADLEIFSPGAGKSLGDIVRNLQQMKQSGAAFRGIVSGTQLADLFESSGLSRSALADALDIKGNEYEINRQLMTTRMSVESAINAINTSVTKKTGKPLGDLAKSVQGETIAGKLNAIREQFEEMVAGADLSPIINGLGEFLKLISTIDPRSFIVPLQDAMKELARPDVMSNVTSALVQIVKMLPDIAKTLPIITFAALQVVKVGDNLRSIWKGLADADISPRMRGVAVGLLSMINPVFGAISVFRALWGILSDGKPVLDKIGELFLIVPSMLAPIPAALVDIGISMVDGIWNGIKSAWGRLTDNVKGVSEKLIQSFKDAFKIASPSRLMAITIGRPIVAGIGAGIDSGAKQVGDSVDRVVSSATGDTNRSLITASTPTGSPIAKMAASGGGGKEVRVNFAPVFNLDGGVASGKEQLAAAVTQTISELRRQVTNIFREAALEAAPVME